MLPLNQLNYLSSFLDEGYDQMNTLQIDFY